MAQINRFEEINSWQGARILVREIYRISSQGRLSKDYLLRDQLRRAALSIMLNIAEGFARRTNGEFRHFLYIAHGSAAEVQSALYVALDLQYLTQPEFEKLYRESDRVSRMLAGFISYLNRHS